MRTSDRTTWEGAFSSAIGRKGAIRGTVKYPWGTVGGAIVTAGGVTANADCEGRYEISGLDVAVYSVGVQARFPGYETSTRTVELAPGETKTVDLYLDFVKSIVEGYVYDTDGKRIAGATLSGVQCGKDMATTTTDERGHFAFEQATPGARFVRVNASGYMGETRDFVAKEEGTTTLEFHLAPASCKIHGTITDRSGRPLAAELLLYRSSIILQKTTSSAETGYYEFALLPDIYDINASAPGCMSNGWRGSISTDTKIDMRLDPMPKPAETREDGCDFTKA